MLLIVFEFLKDFYCFLRKYHQANIFSTAQKIYHFW